jgi:hypothetical protein
MKSGANPYDLEKRDDADARDADLVGLNGIVELGLEDPETLHADVIFKLTTKRAAARAPLLHQPDAADRGRAEASKAPQMIINSIEDGEGHDLTWVKTGQAAGIVIFSKELPAGTPVTGAHGLLEHGLHHELDVDVLVRRPVRMAAVRPVHRHDLGLQAHREGAGAQADPRHREEDGGRVDGDVRITEWVADSPVEFPSVTYGEYESTESTVVAKKADGTKIPVVIHVDKSGVPVFTSPEGGVGVRIRDIIQITRGRAQTLADQAANSLNLYREIYGVDYPYGKLDLVNDPLGSFYGQSPSSLIYLGEGTFASQGLAGEMGGANLSKFNRTVVAHEVGHQWWGSLIPNSNNGNYWFVESLAEYSSALYVEATEGKDAYFDKVADWRRVVLRADLQSSVQDASVVWSGTSRLRLPGGGLQQGAVRVPRDAHDVGRREVLQVPEAARAGPQEQGDRDPRHPEGRREVLRREHGLLLRSVAARRGESRVHVQLQRASDRGPEVDPRGHGRSAGPRRHEEGPHRGAVLHRRRSHHRHRQVGQGVPHPAAHPGSEDGVPAEAPGGGRRTSTFNKYGESLAYDVIVNKIASN